MPRVSKKSSRDGKGGRFVRIRKRGFLCNIFCVCVCVCVRVCVCVCVFIKLHITTQSGPVILVILCHSH